MTRPRTIALATGAALAALVLGPLTAPSAIAGPPAHGGGFVPDGRTVTPSAGMRALRAAGVRSATAAGTPVAVDLTPWAVPAGNQGQVDSCVSWAIGHSLLGWYSNRMGQATTFAPMYIYSQTHVDDSPGGGGSYVYRAFDVVDGQGVDTAADYQPQGDFDFSDLPTAAQTANAAPYQTLGYSRLYASADGGVGSGAQTAIEQSLAAERPVGLAIPIYQNFYWLDSADSDFTDADATGAIDGYHYVAVLGYDATGVEIENSWGTDWGDHGFAHLDWSFVNARSVEAESALGFSAATLPTPDVTPSPTPTTDPTTTDPTPTPDPTTTTEPTPDPTTTTAPTPAPDPAPVAPHGLRVRARSTALDVSWSATPRAARYRLAVTDAAGSRTLQTNATHVVVSGLHAGRSYGVALEAVSATGVRSQATSTTTRTLVVPRVTRFTAVHGRLRWQVAASSGNPVTGFTLVVRRAGHVVVTRRLGPAVRTATIALHGSGTSTTELVARTRGGDTVTAHVTLR